MDYDHYKYRVTWSEEDEEYIGLCAEFSSLSWLAETPEKALKGIREIIAEVIEDMKESGEKIPESFAIKLYSGKFMVRILPEIHRDFAIQALHDVAKTYGVSSIAKKAIGLTLSVTPLSDI